jgi:transketolase
MNALAVSLPVMIGGSADLNSSTHTVIKNGGDFQNPGYEPRDKQGSIGGGWGYHGRNIHFGVREHAMGAIANGMAAHGGVLPFASTFFVFSDYMRPPMRLAALMGLGVIFIFTHDSIGVGEDGPTHQPIEQLAALRAIPGLIVIRPCDANETAVAMSVAIEMRNRPVALVLTRQEVPTMDRTRYGAAEGLRRGAYILEDAPGGKPDLILMATGSEVAIIVSAQQRLAEQGKAVRTVSMPSWELFEAQPREYRDTILPPSIRARLAVEAGVSQGWRKYVGDMGETISLDRFGASAPSKVVLEKLGYTVDNAIARAATLLKQ